MTVKQIVYGGFSIVFLALCSWISIPFAVPFTMQTFAVYFICFLFGGKRATLYVFAYLLCGAIGLPVFSGFKGGVQALFDLTGGYILGFLWIALWMALTQRWWNPNRKIFLFFASIGLFICYIFGTVWFFFVSMSQNNVMTLGAILLVCVVPFVIPDLIKIGLAYGLGKRFKKYVE